jgi:hypothetical protein
MIHCCFFIDIHNMGIHSAGAAKPAFLLLNNLHVGAATMLTDAAV